MSVFLFSNNGVSTLAASINSTVTTITLATGTGALFPSPMANKYFALTLTPLATPAGPPREVVYCTARSIDTLTVVRGQEGTSAAAWTAGDNVFGLITAGALTSLAPLDSPALIGAPTAPTPTSGDSSTLLATTAFVGTAVADALVFAASLTANGYQKLPSGLIIQWGSGTMSIPTSNFATANLTFAIPFPNAVLACVPTYLFAATGAGVQDAVYLSALSTTSVTIVMDYLIAGGDTGTATVYYIAIGY